jgi:hypothetical protein
MARIRTIKPEFFRHEDLQELENKHHGKYPMLVYAEILTLCDKSGRFEWKPRQIKLDILPFINFDMEETLNLLLETKFIMKYEVDGKYYGLIPTFTSHQRITGKEALSPNRYPAPPVKQKGNGRETTGKQPRSQEREREKEKEKEKEKESAFHAFWQHYPKKKARPKAEKAFLKINPDEQLLQIIIFSIDKSKTTEEWLKEKGKYIPSPATWLNDKRWLDEETELHPLAGKVSDKTIQNIESFNTWSPPV